MKKKIAVVLFSVFILSACSQESKPTAAEITETTVQTLAKEEETTVFSETTEISDETTLSEEITEASEEISSETAETTTVTEEIVETASSIEVENAVLSNATGKTINEVTVNVGDMNFSVTPTGESFEVECVRDMPFQLTISFEDNEVFVMDNISFSDIDGKFIVVNDENTVDFADEIPAVENTETEYDPNDGCIGDEGLFW